MKSAGFIGVGSYLPPKIVTNDDIIKMGLETSDEWITERTGIKERRICAPDMSSSDMAFEAAQRAIAHAGVEPRDIDLLIVATTSSDYPSFPSTACLLQRRLNLRKIGAFDLSAACTGFNYALTCASQFVQTGQAKYVLVVGVDCLSKFVDWTDRSVCILFGDGAGAAVVGPVKEGYGILASDLYSDGSESDILMVKGGGSRTPFSQSVIEKKEHTIHMNGKAVFKVAVQTIVPAILHTLNKVDLTPSDIHYLIPHQANMRIIEYAREKLGLQPEQVCTNIQRYGNTSAASIPITLDEAVRDGRIQEESLVVLAGFGAGFTWGVNVLKWGGKGGL